MPPRTSPKSTSPVPPADPAAAPQTTGDAMSASHPAPQPDLARTDMPTSDTLTPVPTPAASDVQKLYADAQAADSDRKFAPPSAADVLPAPQKFGLDTVRAGDRWEHLKTGKIYSIVGLSRQSTNGEHDGRTEVVYRGGDGMHNRDAVEFLDGRFTRLERERASGQHDLPGLELVGADEIKEFPDELAAKTREFYQRQLPADTRFVDGDGQPCAETEPSAIAVEAVSFGAVVAVPAMDLVTTPWRLSDERQAVMRRVARALDRLVAERGAFGLVHPMIGSKLGWKVDQRYREMFSIGLLVRRGAVCLVADIASSGTEAYAAPTSTLFIQPA